MKRLDLRLPDDVFEAFNTAFAISDFKTKAEFVGSFCGAVKTEQATLSEIAEVPEMKNDMLHIRISGKEKVEILNTFKKSTEKSIGTFLYKAVKNMPIIIKEVKIMDDNVSTEYRKIGVNMNQIAKIANQRGSVDIEVQALLVDIKKGLFTKSQI